MAVGLHAPLAAVTVVHAVTPHRGDDIGQADIASSLGMVWRTDALPYCEARRRLKRWYANDPVAQSLRGGVFASGRA